MVQYVSQLKINIFVTGLQNKLKQQRKDKSFDAYDFFFLLSNKFQEQHGTGFRREKICNKIVHKNTSIRTHTHSYSYITGILVLSQKHTFKNMSHTHSTHIKTIRGKKMRFCTLLKKKFNKS